MIIIWWNSSCTSTTFLVRSMFIQTLLKLIWLQSAIPVLYQTPQLYKQKTLQKTSSSLGFQTYETKICLKQFAALSELLVFILRTIIWKLPLSWVIWFQQINFFRWVALALARRTAASLIFIAGRWQQAGKLLFGANYGIQPYPIFQCAKVCPYFVILTNECHQLDTQMP